MVALKDHQFVHFSCHGLSETDPSKSSLLSMDWEENPLTVSDVASSNIQDGQFAYLSACYTSGGMDIHLLDEFINLSSAIQLAGYPSVIGTLWHVMDKESSEIAEQVYIHMVVSGRKAFADRPVCRRFASRSSCRKTKITNAGGGHEEGS
jgi:CHAT domain-containing protein